MLNNMSNRGSIKPNAEQWKELSVLQKKIIKLETKLMFEKDKNTKLNIREKLNELNKKRWGIINGCN